MARVRGVMAAATASGSMLYVASSTSTSTGVAPQYTTALAVAMNASVGQMTSSPGPTSSARRARCSATAQFETAIPSPAPTYSSNAASNSATSTPGVSHPLLSTATAAARSSSPRYGRVGGIPADPRG